MKVDRNNRGWTMVGKGKSIKRKVPEGRGRNMIALNEYGRRWDGEMIKEEGN